MKVIWSEIALADLDAIFDYIAADNLDAAVKVDHLIETSVGGLAQFPEKGRLGRVDETRELVIAAVPYLAVYRLEDGVVRVLRILHGAVRWPESFQQ